MEVGARAVKAEKREGKGGLRRMEGLVWLIKEGQGSRR